MKSITIRGLEGKLGELIKKKAQAEGISLNKAINRLLKQALGLNDKKQKNNYEEFSDLSGVWSEEDEEEYLRAVSDLEKIDSGDWQ